MVDIPTEKYYVTPQEVRDYMGVSYTTGAFSDTNLNNLIVKAMGRVDYITNNVWNGRRRRVREQHSLTRYRGGWVVGLGFPIYTSHYPVRDILSLKVFWNGEYNELVGTLEEGRNKMSYWVQEIDGTLYIQKFLMRFAGEEVIIEYTYGRDDLPYFVKRLTLLYVVRDLIRTSRYIDDMPEDAGIGLKDELDNIEKEIVELERMHTAIRKAINYEDLGEYVV